MAQCPVCNGNISDDFGLIECPSCAAPLLVHMDGRVEHSGAKEENFDFGEAPEIEIPAETTAPENFAPVEEPIPEFAPEPEFEAEPQPEAEMAIPQEASSEAPAGDVFTMPEEPEAEVYRAPSAEAGAKPGADSSDLSDIARFGNSGISANDGTLRYNIFITGIDTADVREAFREAITDRKLVWDIDQILRSLKNGEVIIQNATAPKAFILISRLRNIPVQVRWEQYALSQVQT